MKAIWTWRGAFAAVAAFTALTSLLRAAEPATAKPKVGSEKIAPFALADQYGTNHLFELPLAKPCLLTVADKKGSQQVPAWVLPMHEKHGDKIIYAGVADVSGAPWLLRSTVRRDFRKDYTHPVMLDWKGDVSKRLGAIKGRVAVVAVAPDGAVLWRGEGEPKPDDLKQLNEALETAVKRQVISKSE